MTVTSVFGRIGAVVAQAGDYAASLVTNDSGVAGSFVSDALDTLNGSIGAIAASLASLTSSNVANSSGVGGSSVTDALNTLSSSSGVSSVFSRTGAVTAKSGDYAASQVTNDSGVGGKGVSGALDTLNSAISALVTGVSSVYGRTGAVTAKSGDYTASQVTNDSSGVGGKGVSGALDTLNANVTPWQTWGGTTVGNSTSLRLLQIVPNLAAGTVEADAQWPCGAAGVLTNLVFNLEVALATANLTVTVRINGVNTALTCTINAGATTGSDTTHRVAVALGDKISIGIVASAADATTSRPRAAVGFAHV